MVVTAVVGLVVVVVVVVVVVECVVHLHTRFPRPHTHHARALRCLPKMPVLVSQVMQLLDPCLVLGTSGDVERRAGDAVVLGLGFLVWVWVWVWVLVWCQL